MPTADVSYIPLYCEECGGDMGQIRKHDGQPKHVPGKQHIEGTQRVIFGNMREKIPFKVDVEDLKPPPPRGYFIKLAKERKEREQRQGVLFDTEKIGHKHKPVRKRSKSKKSQKDDA
tara:strand:+ start:431 stop:781 length:351 start_codon:yes stop_codon:yes gene_type:complete